MSAKRLLSASGFLFAAYVGGALCVLVALALWADSASAHPARGASYAVSLPHLHDNPLEVGVPVTTPTAMRTLTPIGSPTRTPTCGASPVWTTVAGPTPASGSAGLSGIAALASDDVWAVGYGPGNTTLIQHWDGAQWSMEPAPEVGTLAGISASSQGNVWAVGGTSALRWNGVQWNLMPSPGIGNLTAVAALSPNDVWAVTTGARAVHWDGTTWTATAAFCAGCALYGVDALAFNDVWAVGSNNGQSLTVHWNGANWTIVASNSTTGGTLRGVSAISPNDVWAAGNYLDNQTTYSRTYVQHWDGTQWTVVASYDPSPRDQIFYAISAAGPGDVWAVGTFCPWFYPYCSPNRVLIEHWDGAQWSMVPGFSGGGWYNALYGVAALSSGDVWAAGTYHDFNTGQDTQLTGHYGCPPPSGTPSSTPTVTLTPAQTFTRTPTWTATVFMTFTPTPARTFTFTATPTSTRLPDLVGNLAWARFCITPGLHVTTAYIGGGAIHPPAGPSTMRLENRAGAFIDFPVPQLAPNASYTVDCLLGDCLPGSWTLSLPFTLTVDYFNVVREHDETNNTYVLTIPPPPEGPCNTETPTATVTHTATGTATPTATAMVTITDTPINTPTNTPTTTLTLVPSHTPANTATPCSAPSFSDVLPIDYFYAAVSYLYCRAAISGYLDGTFRPYNDMTRGQVVKVVVIALRIPINTQGGPHFTDVPATHPFYVWVETAYNRGIISGYSDGTFRPYNNVTRAQLMAIICRALGVPPADPVIPSFSDVPTTHPFYGYIEAAYCRGLITGYSDGTFRPYNNVTRAQVSAIVYRSLTGHPVCGTPTPVVGGQ